MKAPVYYNRWYSICRIKRGISMFSRELEIKKSSGRFVAKGLFYLTMLLLSVFCCLSSWIFYINENYANYITAIGFAATLYFTYLFTYTIYRSIRPQNALVLTEKGIYDFVTDPNKGVFVNWDNVSAVKIFGSDKSPLLGIDLYDSDILIESLKKNVAEEIRSNIEAGLPAIVIRQADIAPSLPQVLPAFNEFISLTRPIPTVKNAPMSSKISDETTDDSIFVVANQTPAPDPKVEAKLKKMEKEEEIYIIPPEPESIFKPDGEIADFKADQKENAAADFSTAPVETAAENTVSPKNEKPAFDDFRFESGFTSVTESKEYTNEINLARTKEMSAVKKPAEPATEQQTADAVKEEPQRAQKKEIKTLEELLAQFSVPTNKDKK